LGFDEVSSDNHTGLKWQTGSASEASGDDVLSEEVDDYWADENQWWGTPRSTYLAEKDKTWVTQKKGRTEFKIRRLTDKGMKMVNDSDMFEQLVEFIRVVWSRLILRKLLGKHGRNVTITLKHPAREFEELIISTIEGLGEDFIDWTSDEFIGENFLQIPGVSPKIFTHDITTPDGVLKVTWITGVQKAFATRFPDDRMYDLLYYDDDPYPGFYFFGNGRLFHRAYQPDLTGAWDTKQKLPRSGREATQRKIDLGKGQNAYFVAMVMFDGPAVAIPFSGPVKWSVDKNHPYYGTAIDIAVRLGREGNSIMALVQELGASDEFRQGFQTADSAEEGGGDGADDNDGGGEKE
jgi:hypothetical protein